MYHEFSIFSPLLFDRDFVRFDKFSISSGDSSGQGAEKRSSIGYRETCRLGRATRHRTPGLSNPSDRRKRS